MSDFDYLFHQTLELSDVATSIDLVAAQYYEETELYDKSVCRVIDEFGITRPTSHRELALINKNAIKVFKRLLKENPITERELRCALRRINEKSYDRRK